MSKFSFFGRPAAPPVLRRPAPPSRGLKTAGS